MLYLAGAGTELLRFGSCVYYQVHSDRQSYKYFKVGTYLYMWHTMAHNDFMVSNSPNWLLN